MKRKEFIESSFNEVNFTIAMNDVLGGFIKEDQLSMDMNTFVRLAKNIYEAGFESAEEYQDGNFDYKL